MGNLIVSAVVLLILTAIVRKLWINHKSGVACSSACTACPVVTTCAKDNATIKRELSRELHNH